MSPTCLGYYPATSAARSALSDMRRLLGVLRNDEAAALAPQPQIEQIPNSSIPPATPECPWTIHWTAP
jgi:hypothetical protein